MKYLIIALQIFLVYYTIGQTATTEKRLEIDIKDGYSDEQIYEFEASGILIFSKQDKKEGSNVVYRFQKCNTDLVLTEELNHSISKDFSFQSSFKEGKNLNFLFKNKKGDYQIIRYDFLKNNIKEISGKLPPKTFVSSTSCLDDVAYMLLRDKKFNYQMLSIDLNSGTQTFNPIFKEGIKHKNFMVTGLESMPESKNLLLSSRIRITKKISEMNIFLLNKKGAVEQITELKAEFGNTLKDARSFDMGENNFIVTGTYAAQNKGGSTGIYITRIENGVTKPIFYHNFTDLKNFFNYLPQKTQERIEKKKERKNKKGQELNYSYLIASHKPIKVGNDFLYVGEAFYPTYRREPRTTTTYVNGKPVTKTTYVSVFDGYQYTHAFVAKFTKDGKLLWDESFPMWIGEKPYYVKRFIHIDEHETEKLKLVFATYRKITTKIFDFDGKVISDKESNEIETSHEDDKTRNSSADIIYWYENYFLTYGKQRITNKKESEHVRNVYYFNKVKVD